MPNVKPKDQLVFRLPFLNPKSKTAAGAHLGRVVSDPASAFTSPIVSPGTGHVVAPPVGRGTGTSAPQPIAPRHPASNVPAPSVVAPKLAKGVGGSIAEVGGFVTQTNPGGTTPALVPGSAQGTGYFRNIGSGDLAGRFGLTWVTVAEVAALLLAGWLIYRHYRGGKRR